MNPNQFPALEQFLGGYFHQDFRLDHGSPDGAIEAFVSDATQEQIQAASAELEQALSVIEQMDDPQKLLRALGCDYLPSAHGLTVANWLSHVHKKLGE